MRVFSSLALFSLLLAVQRVAAAPQNITIDDQLGDSVTGELPRYIPTVDEWHNQDCGPCAIKPDVSELFENTVMQTTFRPERHDLHSVDFNFNGTAIYIYFTLYNWELADGVITLTECNFTIDGGSPTFFRHVGNPELHGVRDYQSLVYQRTGLTDAPHHMNISISGIDHQAFLSFDYAIYTMDTQAPNATPNTTTTTSASTRSTTTTGTVTMGSAPTITEFPENPNTNTSQSGSNNSDSNNSSKVSVGTIAGGLISLIGTALFFV